MYNKIKRENREINMEDKKKIESISNSELVKRENWVYRKICVKFKNIPSKLEQRKASISNSSGIRKNEFWVVRFDNLLQNYRKIMRKVIWFYMQQNKQ